MINYRLHVFQVVAELGNISKASRTLHLSQPAVSKHIKLLEEELRVPLFIRSATGMIPTHAGETFLRHVQRVAKAHVSIAKYLQAPTGVLSGRLCLGVSKTIFAYYVPDVLSQFKKRHPGVTCEIVEGNSDVIVGAMLERRIDLGLIEGPCGRPDMQTRPFFNDEIVWIASPSDPLAKKKSCRPEDLLKRPLVTREVGCGTRRYMEMALRKMHLPLKRMQIVQELISIEAIKRIIGDGLGIGYVSRLSVEQELASGKLVQIHCPALTIRRPFFILFPQGPDPMGVAHTFIQILLEKSDAAPAITSRNAAAR